MVMKEPPLTRVQKQRLAPTERMRKNRINCIFKQCVYDIINIKHESKQKGAE
jgi:hypothetical protein